MSIFHELFQGFFHAYGLSKAEAARKLGVDENGFYHWMSRLEDDHKGYVAIEALLLLVKRDPTLSMDRIYEVCREEFPVGIHTCSNIQALRKTREMLSKQLTATMEKQKRIELLRGAAAFFDVLSDVFCVACPICVSHEECSATPIGVSCPCTRFNDYLLAELKRIIGDTPEE